MIFERIVLNRLLDIDTFNDALPSHQFGFRSRHSAIEQIHRVVNHIPDALKGHKYCSAFFLMSDRLLIGEACCVISGQQGVCR